MTGQHRADARRRAPWIGALACLVLAALVAVAVAACGASAPRAQTHAVIAHATARRATVAPAGCPEVLASLRASGADVAAAGRAMRREATAATLLARVKAGTDVTADETRALAAMGAALAAAPSGALRSAVLAERASMIDALAGTSAGDVSAATSRVLALCGQ